jgi:hypothetical protein
LFSNISNAIFCNKLEVHILLVFKYQFLVIVLSNIPYASSSRYWISLETIEWAISNTLSISYLLYPWLDNLIILYFFLNQRNFSELDHSFL